MVYKVQGTWIRCSGGQIIVFNLENAISVLITPEEASASKKRRIELLPEQWENSFGEEFYDHVVENEMFYIAESPAWQAQRPSVPAPGIAQYSAPTEEELHTMMETLVREAVAGYAGT